MPTSALQTEVLSEQRLQELNSFAETVRKVYPNNESELYWVLFDHNSEVLFIFFETKKRKEEREEAVSGKTGKSVRLPLAKVSVDRATKLACSGIREVVVDGYLSPVSHAAKILREFRVRVREERNRF